MLFALLKDDSDGVSNESFIDHLQSDFFWAKDYDIRTTDLIFPRTTVVDMVASDGWDIQISIRPGDDMTLSMPELRRILAPKAALPDEFDDYNVEVAMGFGDDPARVHTNDIIHFTEFVKEIYPGVVIFDQYQEDVW